MPFSHSFRKHAPLDLSPASCRRYGCFRYCYTDNPAKEDSINYSADSSSYELVDSNSSNSSDSEEASIEIVEGSGSDEVFVQKVSGVLPGPDDIRKKRGLPSYYDIRKKRGLPSAFDIRK